MTHRSRFLAALLLVVAVSSVASFRDLARDTVTSDEAQWIHVSGKTWPLFRDGEWDHAYWESMASSWGYVNPQVGKYLIAIALDVQGVRWERTGNEPAPDDVLLAGRRASASFAVLGTAAMFLLGTMLFGLRAGTVAALLLAVSPFWLHVARHVLTDVYCQTLGLFAVAAGTAGLRELSGEARWRIALPWTIASGVLLGLAVGTKLNAAPLAVVLGLAMILVLIVRVRRATAGPVGAAAPVVVSGLVFGGAAVIVFLATNPYLYEDAWNRFAGMLEFWRTMSERRAANSAAGGFGRAFFPQDRGLEVLTGKLLIPWRWASLLLLLPPVIAGLRARTQGPAAARPVLWLLLVPVAAILFLGKQQILHPWIAWVGILAGALLPVVRGRSGTASADGPLRFLVPLWFLVVAALLWKEMHLPQSRYYVPGATPLLLLAGAAFAGLRESLDRRGRWCVDGAIGLGVLSVMAASPVHTQALRSEVLLEAGPVAVLHWLAVLALPAALVPAILPGTRRDVA